jgi:hypothetical protein
VDDSKWFIEVDTEGGGPDLPEGNRVLIDILSETMEDKLPPGQDLNQAPPVYK